MEMSLEAQNEVFTAADLLLDVPRMRLTAPGRSLEELTPTEFELLTALARHPGRITTRSQFIGCHPWRCF